MLRIVKYTEALRRQLHSNVATDDCMHCLLYDDGKSVAFAIYVWDVRKVLESGQVNWFNVLDFAVATDNHRLIEGDDIASTKFNSYIYKPER